MEQQAKQSGRDRKKQKKTLTVTAVCIAGVFILLAAGLFDWDSLNQYKSYNTEALHYVKARVVSVERETLQLDETDHTRYLGEQELSVEILEGSKKGEVVNVVNYLTRIHNVHVRIGQAIILCADTPENAEAYYTVFQYDRSGSLIVLLLVFAASMLLVGRGKGLRALMGVVYTLLILILFTMQAIYHGFHPLAVAALSIILCTGISLLLLNGISKRTAVAVASTTAGVCVTGVVFALFSGLLHLSGYNMENAETLLLIGESTGLLIRHLLLVSVLISALGAVMDVAVSLTAALEEMVCLKPEIKRNELFRAGMNVGKDMIGTMSNTLILAYAGTALNTMLCLMAYGYQFRQLLSSDYLTIELAQGLCATIGVVLTVPVTTAIAVVVMCRSGEFRKQP